MWCGNSGVEPTHHSPDLTVHVCKKEEMNHFSIEVDPLALLIVENILYVVDFPYKAYCTDKARR